MIDRFHPDVLWFDFGWHADRFLTYRPQVVAYYYNHALQHGYEPVLQYKDKLPAGSAVWDIERGKLNSIRPEYWQTDTSVSYKSWSYIQDDAFKTPATVIHDLVDIVSKNGNLLLNIGPRADGTIAQEAADILRELGGWLRINGEAIYMTRPWLTFGEGNTKVGSGQMSENQDQPFTAEDIRFTFKGNKLYAIVLGWPTGAEIRIKSLARGSGYLPRSIAEVELLGSPQKIAWTRDQHAFCATLPREKPCEHAFVLKIAISAA